MKISGMKKRTIIWMVSLAIFAGGAGICGCADDDEPGSRNSGSDQTEQSVFSQINQYRQAQGFSTLVWDDTIATYCRIHSMDMAAGRVSFGHDGFDGRIDRIEQSITVSAAAENVASNNYPDPASVAVDGWLNSPGHLDNIEGDYDLTGVGVAVSSNGNYFFTQIFIRQ